MQLLAPANNSTMVDGIAWSQHLAMRTADAYATRDVGQSACSSAQFAKWLPVRSCRARARVCSAVRAQALHVKLQHALQGSSAIVHRAAPVSSFELRAEL